jgi:hypothetical protein
MSQGSMRQAPGGCNCGGGGVVCLTCAPHAIPTTLTVTDALGSYTATWNGSTYWLTPQLCSDVVTPVAGCVDGMASCVNFIGNSGRTIYYYAIGCVDSGMMEIFRLYFFLNCGFNPNAQYVPCNCGFLTAASGESLSGPIPVTCGSISWTGSLTNVGLVLPDPVGGTVSFNQ